MDDTVHEQPHGLRAADKKLGSALLRKIAITEFAKRGKGSREALAKAMRHKLDTGE